MGNLNTITKNLTPVWANGQIICFDFITNLNRILCPHVVSHLGLTCPSFISLSSPSHHNSLLTFFPLSFSFSLQAQIMTGFSVPVCPGCHNKTPQTAGLKDSHLFSHSSGVWGSEIKLLANLIPSEDF